MAGLYNISALILLGLLLITPAQLVYAGGSYQNVEIEYFSKINATDYVLKVIPPSDNIDSYMQNCEIFTVIGKFSRYHDWFLFHEGITRKNHIQALSFIKNAFEKGQKIKLGWMGQGFVRVKENDPCVVKSRAFEFYGDGSKILRSYYENP